MEQEKIFVGSAKTITTQYGDLTKVSFSESDLQKLTKNLNNGWVNCVIKEKKNKVEGKPTHYLEIDKWKPTQQESSESVPATPIQSDNDLPF